MNKEEIKQELNFEVFKTHIAEMLKKVYSKLDNEEKEFINLLVEVLNEKCEENERLKEIEKEHQRINGELREVIKKAIEYIEYDLKSFLYSEEYKILLKILNKSK